MPPEIASNLLAAHIPMDRRFGLLEGNDVPQETEGAILIADLQGFTRLGEELVRQLGPWEGAETLNRQVNDCFTHLIAAVHTFRGSVVRFAGDAILAIFTGKEDSLGRATAAAYAFQTAMEGQQSLSFRAGIGFGPIQRRLVGDPAYGLHDLVSGPALRQALAALEKAPPGDVRGSIAAEPAAPDPWPRQDWDEVPEESLLPWVPPTIHARLVDGAAAFVAELRQVVPLFLQVDCPKEKLVDYVPQVQSTLAPFEVSLNGVDILDKGPVLVVCFGAPVAQGDDPVRAVEAALALMETEQRRSQRIGISMGPVYAGLIGSPVRRAYTLYGDEMNLAARLMEAAAPGEILTSAPVSRAAGRRYRFTSLGAIPVRGRKEPVQITRVEGERTALRWPERGPLVSRREEMAQLKGIMEHVRTRHGQVAILSGEAGIGKSHLAAELVQRWSEEGGRAIIGQAQASAQQQAYATWDELLRALFRLRGDRRDEDRLREVILAADPALLPRLPLLGDVLGIPLPESDLTRSMDPDLRQASTQTLVVDLLRAQEEPLLLLLEDVQWLDGPSWALTLTAARRLVDRPILLCLTGRPMDSPPIEMVELSALPTCHILTLNDFPPQEVVELAQVRLGVATLPTELADFLQSQGQGNPFFIEELLHTLQEEGFLHRENDRVLLTHSLDEAHPPDNVQGAVLARIDRLDEPSRLTLKVASVIGRTFPYPVLRAVHPAEPIQETRLLDQLDRLQSTNILLMEMVEPDLTYLFKQAVTHEVTYGTLLFSQRRQLHEEIARYYERRYQDHLAPYYALLAYHYSRSDNEEQQIHYCQQAGQEAARRYANAEAISFYTQALEILTEKAASLQGAAWQKIQRHRWDLLKQREAILSRTGQREEQWDDIEAMLTLAQALDQPGLHREVLYRQGYFLYLVNDYEQAQETLGELLRSAQSSGDALMEGKGLHIFGRIAYYRGYCQEALGYYLQALKIFRAVGAEHETAEMLNSLGLAYYSLGAYDQALDYYRQAMVTYRRTDDYSGEIQSRGNIALVHWDAGQYEQAMEQFQQILALARQTGSRRHEAFTLHNIGDLYRYMGRPEEAIQILSQAISLCDEIDSLSLRGECMNNLGRAYLEQDRFEPAREHLAEALQIRQELDEVGCVVLDLSFLARALLGQGKVEEALAHSRQAMELMATADVAVDWEQQIHYNHYVVCRRANRPQEAAQSLEDAYQSMHALAGGMGEESRRSFLEEVKVNQEITAAWESGQYNLAPPSPSPTAGR